MASLHLTLHTALLRATDIVNCGPKNLYNSWALNLETDIYIYNNRNCSNYIITYIATALDVINFSKQTYLIESFGIIIINIDIITKLAYFQLQNVALAFGFISNLIFINILAKQYIY